MRKFFLLFIFLFLSLSSYSQMQPAPIEIEKEVLQWNPNGLSIELKDHLNIEEMVWPNTLLEYPIDFAGELDLEELKLMALWSNHLQQYIPIQFSDIVSKGSRVRSATLCFLSDLKSGETKKFVLRSAINPKQRGGGFGGIKVEKNNNQVILSNRLIKVSMNTNSAYPILNIGTSEKELSSLYLPRNLSVERIDMDEISVGNLFAEYRLTCSFEKGKRYALKVRLISEMEFVEIEETINGFSPSDSLCAKLEWNNFKPDYRFCPNRALKVDPKMKGYNNYRWESMTGLDKSDYAERHPLKGYDQQNTPEGKLPFELSLYHNWLTWWRLHTATFWNVQGEAVGVFIKDFEKWADPQYPLWGSKNNMSIKYYYTNNDEFHWRFPLSEGSRSVAISLYPHSKNIGLINRTEQDLFYTDYLRRWYGWISLNKVKNWILDYPMQRKTNSRVFSAIESGKEREHSEKLLTDLKRRVKEMSRASERSNYGPNPVGNRTYSEELMPLFNRVENILTDEEYKQARSYYLFMAYVSIDESLMPMKTMLSGHPNFLADIKSVPATAAFLFPDHPHAKEMADHYEKSLALNLRYHTRPEVKEWDAKGGRSTENLACYTWAFLKASLRPSILLHHHYDGKNRILQPNVGSYANWLLCSLTSPLDMMEGYRGVPPQGAHARKADLSNLLNLLGHELRYYNPLLADHIKWSTNPNSTGFEDRGTDQWKYLSDKLLALDSSKGTNPRLESEKHTGYGFTMRENFGQQDEMYVHLQQLDEGPNYRWGRAAQGGNGVVYYTANGKRYSHNGAEDVGDGPFGDVERSTNFGIKRKQSYRDLGEYRSIGRNDLTEPLYDFEFFQYSSVQGGVHIKDDYRSRSVMMVDADYILIYDDVTNPFTEGRLSWFVGTDDDFPFIHQLKPGVAGENANIKSSQSSYHKDPLTIPTKGKYYNGKGDFLTLVSHKENIKPRLENNVIKINRGANLQDLIFRGNKALSFDQEALLFEGKAGIIRKTGNGKEYAAALFEGAKIGIPQITLEWETAQKGGMSIHSTKTGFEGYIQVRKESNVLFHISNRLFKSHLMYVDGREVQLQEVGKGIYSLTLPEGRSHWQLSSAGAIPARPKIERTMVGKTWCTLAWNRVEGATSYTIEKSEDGGDSWREVKNSISGNHAKVDNLTLNQKVHFRVIALGKGGASKPSNDYPAIPTASQPHAPEGLLAVPNKGKLDLSWGHILGADSYKLYMKKEDSKDFVVVYEGNNPSYSINELINRRCMFYATASNDNGESKPSHCVDTDNSSILNWYPVPDEVFRRDVENHENGFDEYNPWKEEQMPILTYPEFTEN